MTHLTTRLVFRALFAIVMQTEVHADEAGTCISQDRSTAWTSSADGCRRDGGMFVPLTVSIYSPPVIITTDTSHGVVTNSGPTQFVINKDQWCKLYDYPAADGCVRPQPAATHCAPGHEQACQQRDHGTDGLRRSEQK